MEETKSEKVCANKLESNDQYTASYLKTGSMRGVMYQMKLLTWISWKLMSQKDTSIDKWWLATEVKQARGFHDLVLKYSTNGSSDKKYMYRFVQIKHKTSLKKNTNINSYHLTSGHKDHRQCSLIYLFKSYVNILDNFEKITPDQVVDLTIITNMNIDAFKFLVPAEPDKLYGFKEKGKRYRIDIKVLQKEPRIMLCLLNIKRDENIIFGFLRKLVFSVSQPSEHELEELIIQEMSKTFNVPRIFYDNLYKNIIEWFLIYKNGMAPYLTEDHVMKWLEDAQDMLWIAKETETLVDPISKISDKLKSLFL